MAFALWMALTAFADERTCTPACDIDEVCTPAGRCVTPCIPACTGDATCNADGVCVTPATDMRTTGTPANVGAGKLCVERRQKDSVARVRWSVLIDGRVAGGLRGGTEQCFETDPGTRTVVVTYVDPTTGARPQASKTVQVTPNGTVHVAVASSGTNIVFE
jgi:hypothetical protein